MDDREFRRLIQEAARIVAEDVLAKLTVLEQENDRLRGHIRVLSASARKSHDQYAKSAPGLASSHK